MFAGSNQLVKSMFAIRAIGRTLFAAATGETSSAAAASTVSSRLNPLEDFFEAERSPDDDKPVVYGINSFCAMFHVLKLLVFV